MIESLELKGPGHACQASSSAGQALYIQIDPSKVLHTAAATLQRLRQWPVPAAELFGKRHGRRVKTSASGGDALAEVDQRSSGKDKT